MSKFWDELIQAHGLPEVPEPSEVEGSEDLGQLMPGAEPVIGAAFADAQGTALPADADGEFGQPIKRRSQFFVAVTWPQDVVADVVAEFTRDDMQHSDFAEGVFLIGNPIRSGSTRTWYVPVTIGRFPNVETFPAVCANFRLIINAGALPQTSTRGASITASKNFVYLLQASPPFITIGVG